MESVIDNETILTTENMGSTTKYFYDVCAYIKRHCRRGDPNQSLQDWLHNGDYNPARTVADVIHKWDEELDMSDKPGLYNYQTGAYIREATPEELAESEDAATHDGGAGEITVTIDGQEVDSYPTDVGADQARTPGAAASEDDKMTR